MLHIGPLVERLFVHIAVAVEVDIIDDPVDGPVAVPVRDPEVAVEIALAGAGHVAVLVHYHDEDGARLFSWRSSVSMK